MTVWDFNTFGGWATEGEEMVEKAKRMALRHGMAQANERVIIMAGIPFGTVGSTNVLHVAPLTGKELDRHRS